MYSDLMTSQSRLLALLSLQEMRNKYRELQPLTGVLSQHVSSLIRDQKSRKQARALENDGSSQLLLSSSQYIAEKSHSKLYRALSPRRNAHYHMLTAIAFKSS